jgi:hypothetical protein
MTGFRFHVKLAIGENRHMMRFEESQNDRLTSDEISIENALKLNGN